MLWHTLIKKLCTYALLDPTHAGIAWIEQIAAAAHKTLPEYLQTVDVRQVAQLRDLVPEAFPRKLRKGTLWVSRNIHGQWQIEPEPQR
jgi:hypothetical protein